MTEAEKTESEKTEAEKTESEKTEAQKTESEAETKQKTIFSLGFRCSSASIIKELGLKFESYPFDWLVSRLHVIRHCIETDFAEFMNKENYVFRITKTYEMASSDKQFICDEHIMLNRFYQPPNLMEFENTYQAHLATNHHNITEPESYDYYQRCIHRFNERLHTNDPLLYVHITPLIPLSDYKEPEAIKECTEFHEFMRSKNDGVTGLFFIMVRDDESPHFRWDLLSDNDDDNKSPTIYLIKANQCFLDAGESFMGDFHREKEFIKGVILEYKN